MRELSIEVSGKTEDDAIQNALAQIGLERDDVSVEILERAKSGVLGFGGKRALVKVTYMSDQAVEPSSPTVTQVPVEVPVTEVSPSPAKVVTTEVASADSQQNASEKASTFLTGLLEKMEVTADISIEVENDTLRIELIGENMGVLIGRRGETLDAMQHLTSYAINHGLEKRVRVFLDAENYRAKREETLIRLANKMAEKVLRYKKNMGLEPMNAYERHIIHTALQDVANISTYSAGAEPNRRVFVAYDRGGTKKKPHTAKAPANPVSDTPQAPAQNYKEWS